MVKMESTREDAKGLFGWLHSPSWQPLFQCLGLVSFKLTLKKREHKTQSENRLLYTGNTTHRGTRTEVLKTAPRQYKRKTISAYKKKLDYKNKVRGFEKPARWSGKTDEVPLESFLDQGI